MNDVYPRRLLKGRGRSYLCLEKIAGRVGWDLQKGYINVILFFSDCVSGGRISKTLKDSEGTLKTPHSFRDKLSLLQISSMNNYFSEKDPYCPQDTINPAHGPHLTHPLFGAAPPLNMQELPTLGSSVSTLFLSYCAYLETQIGVMLRSRDLASTG